MILDRCAGAVGLYRIPGESDAELLFRIKRYYSVRPYEVYLPLFKLLDKLDLKSTKYFFSGVPAA